MGKRIAISQSNYIPWKGYFDLINSVDEFVLYDDMQYTRQDWRNRNRIKTPQGPHWLTIPVQAKGRLLRKIKDTVISDPDWARVHWETLVQNYRRAPHFHTYRNDLETLYREPPSRFLSEVNQRWLTTLCGIMQIDTRITWSMDYSLAEDRNERLVGICRQAGADEYLSGPAAQAYLDEAAFQRAGIKVVYMDYSGYPEYEQLHGPFDHFVTVLDLLLCVGPDYRRFMKSWRLEPAEALWKKAS
jgi:hypothetical protein